MWIGIISLFPEMFRAITDFGVTGRAVKNGLLSIESWSPRDLTYDRHRTVDDRPYGGGPGMLMMVQPLRDAINAARAAAGEGAKVIYLSPQGRKLDQAGVSELATNKKLILVCGRYEGIDERVIQAEIDEEWSIGDYVLRRCSQDEPSIRHSSSAPAPGGSAANWMWPSSCTPREIRCGARIGWTCPALDQNKREWRCRSAWA